MGYPPPRREIGAPLNVASDETFNRWLALPPDDHRTIEEFAADGDILRPLSGINYCAVRANLLDGTDSTGCK